MTDVSLEATLSKGLARLSVPASATQIALLMRYVDELSKWNAVYNLTAIRDPRQMVIQHLLDSLSALPILDLHRRRAAGDALNGGGEPNYADQSVPSEPTDRGEQSKPLNDTELANSSSVYTVLDVGSGGGLPGVVIAIMRPHWLVTVNDIVQKKTAFLSHVKTVLRLDNLTVINGRVETLGEDASAAGLFDIIISRAFADLNDFFVAARHLLAPGGRLYAMKGVRPDAEIACLPVNATVAALLPLKVPELAAQRHMVVIEAH